MRARRDAEGRGWSGRDQWSNAVSPGPRGPFEHRAHAIGRVEHSLLIKGQEFLREKDDDEEDIVEKPGVRLLTTQRRARRRR